MRAAFPVALLALAACAEAPPTRPAGYFTGIETRLLDGDLVNFIVSVEGAATAEVITAYARCAAAQYALIRGYGFARHVRTTVDNKGSNWRGDAVYTISAARPRGVDTIDAEAVVGECVADGIPTV